MQQSNQPTKIQTPFANNGVRNTIPVPSQASTTPGAASYNDGFPGLTMTAISAGGIPPSGKDFNGILYAITSILQWECGGGFFAYDAAWSSANGGYPKGAVLQSAGTNDLWLNQVDGNTTNPDSTDGTAANWVSLASYGIGAVTGLTNANVTLTPSQYSKRIITLAGALTGNIQVTVPNAQRDYTFVNNTTGAYTVTVKTAAGTGVQIPQGQLQAVYCDGMSVNALHAPAVGNAAQTFLVAAASLSGHAVNLGQFTNNLGVSGYQKLAGGLILQWGTSTLSSTTAGGQNGTATVNLPIAAPNSILMAGAFIANLGYAGNWASAATWVNSTSTTQIGLSVTASFAMTNPSISWLVLCK